MGVTKFDSLNAINANIRIVSVLPTTPESYYDSVTGDVDSVTWRGGETCYLSTENRLFIQQNTSGRTAIWKRLLETFATSTSTSSSSSSSSTSSTSTSTSTSSSTSTSTSSSSSTTTA